ncbi:hypothetical protein AB4510_17965 [Vibrio sp. 10N.222.54.B12]|uniref:hypothetical protein n=1 Tax=Vibrio TaxID=662 RepID=UPI000C844F45|nr:MULTISPECIES: hypothetical protein [Vibrio]MCC4789076.1 hypothetical protein [Vibrio splendidus]MDA0155437.1 hypothetical protein [Vibrio sp. Makdt]PMN37535.1 hypothetical protein BCT34_06190 [Vibrio sp. 10N.261.45.E2]PMN47279.1 hypothetical protein BCT32_09820 [Vibrio sp. 10N.261.45.E11]
MLKLDLTDYMGPVDKALLRLSILSIGSHVMLVTSFNGELFGFVETLITCCFVLVVATIAYKQKRKLRAEQL